MNTTIFHMILIACFAATFTGCGNDKLSDKFTAHGKVTNGDVGSDASTDERRTFSLDLDTPADLGWSTSEEPMGSAEPMEPGPISNQPANPREQGIQVECLGQIQPQDSDEISLPEPRYRFLTVSLEADAGFGQVSVVPYNCVGAARLHIFGLESGFHYRLALQLEGRIRYAGESEWFAVDGNTNVPVIMRRVKTPADQVTVDMIFEEQPKPTSTLTCVFKNSSPGNACEIYPTTKPWVAPRICNQNQYGDSCQVDFSESDVYKIVDSCTGNTTELKMQAGGFHYEVLLPGCAQ